jgi:ubiquinone/menaquinone biosynthesis C-methylase UbiE
MDTNRVHHPLFAHVFTRVRPAMDAGGVSEHRRRLLAELSGRVLEVGAGDGANFAHYPSQVDRVLAVEPEPYLRARAEREATTVAVPVIVVDGVAERLPVPDGAVDAAVVSMVLCSVADQRAALRELRRVVRLGGQLRFYEHVRADTAPLRAVQRVLDATVWPHLIGGCHMGRDTVAAIEQAGFRIDAIDRVRFPEFPLPTSLHVVGVATRLDDEASSAIGRVESDAAVEGARSR